MSRVAMDKDGWPAEGIPTHERDFAEATATEWRQMAADEVSVSLRRLYLLAVEDIDRATVIMPKTVRAIRAAWAAEAKELVAAWVDAAP